MPTRHVIRPGFGYDWFATLAFLISAVAGSHAWGIEFDRSAWTNYTNVNEVMGLAATADTLWLATRGGLVHLRVDDPSEPVRITNANGLGDNDLRFVAVDASGGLWTGGLDGCLCRRFHDDWWRNYRFESNGISLALSAAAPGPGGFMWVGSSIGIHKFDIERHGGEIKETYTRIGDWPAANPVEDVLVTATHVWVVGPAGAARADVSDPFLLDPTRWQTWMDLPQLNSIQVFGGHVYVGGSDGLWSFTDTLSVPGDTLWSRVGFAGRDVNSLYASNDTLWVATDHGLGLCTAFGCQEAPALGTPRLNLTSLTGTADGSIWSGQQGKGVRRLQGGEFSLLSFNGPPSNLIFDLALGHDGKVWCAHRADGFSYLEDGQWSAMTSISDSLGIGSGSPAQSVAVAPNGDIWLGIWGGGAVQIEDPANPHDNWIHFDTANSSLIWIVSEEGVTNYIVLLDVAVDGRGRVWFANAWADSGRVLPFYDDGCWGYFERDDGFVSDDAQVLLALDDEVLVGFGSAGLASLDYEPPLCVNSHPVEPLLELTYKNTGDGLPSDDVRAILVDRADSLWVGTNVGLVRWAADIRLFRTVPIPPEAGLTINALAADAVNTIWVGTARGLVRLTTSGETTFFNSENSPLVGDDVREIAIDDRHGVIWIATGSGLTRLESGLTPADDIESVKAFPNPFEVISGGDQEVCFDAPFGSRIFIYTASGQFILEVDVADCWDGRNRSGALVASGVYLFVVRGPDGEYGHGKFALIHRR